MSLTLPYPTLGPGVVNSAELVLNFSAISSKFSGNIDNSDIKAAANISLSKLAASYEYITINLTHISNATFPAAAALLAAQPMYNDGKGAWTCASYAWFCQDVGSQDATITVQWGYYDTGGTWQNTAAIVTGEALNGSGASDRIFQDGAASTQALAWTQSAMVLRVIVGAQGTNVLTTAEDKLGVSITLKRQIAT
jgi:hypothetical protein